MHSKISSKTGTSIHIHTHTYTYTHTHTYNYIHIHTHAYTHTYTHTQTHTYIHTHIYIYIYIIYIHIHVHTHTYTHTYTHTNTYIYTYIHTDGIVSCFRYPNRWIESHNISIHGILIQPHHLNAALDNLHSLHSGDIGAPKVIIYMRTYIHTNSINHVMINRDSLMIILIT